MLAYGRGWMGTNICKGMNWYRYYIHYYGKNSAAFNCHKRARLRLKHDLLIELHDAQA